MDEEQKTRRRLLAAAVLVPALLVAAFWLPRWWEGRELREARAIAGVGSQLAAGHLTDARKKVDPGLAGAAVVAAIGKPSFAVATEGKDSKHEIWTYYFSDGTMTINLTDGTVLRVSAVYGPPHIPKKGGGW